MRQQGYLHAIIQLDARALRNAQASCGGRPVIFGSRRRAQRKIRHRFYPQRRDRPRQADETCRSGASRARTDAQAAKTEAGRGQIPQASRRRSHCVRAPAPEHSEPVKLRCVGVRPRLVSFDELADDDCRYPYGGDREGEPIAFCGHPRFRGSSYCAPHFHLTRGPRIEADRPAGPFVLRLVEAA
jgi:hypothetical protein